MTTLTCSFIKEKLNALFNRVLEDHPENDESILLDEVVINKKGNLETVEALFIYEKSKCSIQYNRNIKTEQISFLFNTFKNLDNKNIEELSNLKQLNTAI